jgi:hypothetical protein
MPAATKLSSAPEETKSPTADRTDETNVRCLLQQTSAAQPASRVNDDPCADDPNMIVRLLLETARLACRRYDRALRAHLPGTTLGRMRCPHTAGAARKAQSSRPRSNSRHQANYARSPA